MFNLVVMSISIYRQPVNVLRRVNACENQVIIVSQNQTEILAQIPEQADAQTQTGIEINDRPTQISHRTIQIRTQTDAQNDVQTEVPQNDVRSQKLPPPPPPIKPPFETPFLPFLPFINIFINVYMLTTLSPATWYRYVIWFVFGKLINSILIDNINI